MASGSTDRVTRNSPDHAVRLAGVLSLPPVSLLPVVRQDRQKVFQRVAGGTMLRAARAMTAATSLGWDS